MTDLREDLYAFRKQMREVFIRVEDMVDVHRSFFKADPSTGSPVFNDELHQESEQLANEAFKQLTDLRRHFTRLAKDFQRSEEPSTAPPRQRRKQGPTRKPASVRRGSHTQVLDDDDASLKDSEVPGDNDSDVQDLISIASSSNDGASTREHSPSIRGSSQDNNADPSSPVVADSVRSTASTYLTSQLHSRWRDDADSVAPSDSATFGTRTRDRSSSIVSDASSLPDLPSGSFSAKCSEPSDTDSIFKGFDKRMEEIRCSLNAIASGKTPHGNSAATPPKFSQRGAGSPIRAMLDATRSRSTRSTLREASRISSLDFRRLDHEDGNSDGGKAGRGGSREAELRHLLQELNQVNASNEDD
ncbi:hypothetical protein KRP22_012968 [Phytophthora ramorum]|nr:hypothetical protein KRP22_8600 [Phytophthora ramorum]